MAALIVALLTCGCGIGTSPGDGGAATITADELATYTRELSDDSLQGRGPAGPGEPPTLEYIQSAYERIGLVPMGDPADDGEGGRTYLQAVEMVGITADPSTASLEFSGGSSSLPAMQFGTDFVTWTTTETETLDIEGDLVFVGYGTVAPEEGWDDYKGQDMTGKVLVMLVGDPPLEDTERFGGAAMTYYGRWTYKYEEAARQGAAGAILVHDTPAAGYGWNVVEASWAGEQMSLPLPEGALPPTPLQGWITWDRGVELFAAAGLDFEQLAGDAVSDDFEPVELDMQATAHLDNTLRHTSSNNVIGAVEGSDPEVSDEYILFAAHWDHFGVGKPIDGDAIYNGALDNATGVGAILEIAEAFATLSPRARRSIMFIATTAEEQGLLGAAYYAAHPIVPLDKTLALINVDGLNTWGPTRDVIVVGLGNSTLDDTLAEVLAGDDRTIAPDAEPEKGFFYRADQFPFAKVGVPVLYTDTGVDFIGKPEDFAEEIRQTYTQVHYHMPSDEFDPMWDFSGAEQDVRSLFEVAFILAQGDTWPEWKPGTEFKAVREEMLGGQ
jgi:Zn-dependent M28 family amino/carboxypeptidase